MRRVMHVCLALYVSLSVSSWLCAPTLRLLQLQGGGVSAAEWTPPSSPSLMNPAVPSRSVHGGPADIVAASSSSLQSDKFHMNIRFLPRDMFSAVSSCIHSTVQVEITNTVRDFIDVYEYATFIIVVVVVVVVVVVAHLLSILSYGC